ncbi:hypothetical protein KKA47_00935, partial [bacterium]|nr:hypothetical protein [bacterium]
AYMKSFGINIDEAHVLLNIDDEYKPEIKQQNYAAIWVYPTYKGTVKNIIKPKIKCDHEIQWHIQPGDNLSDAKNILAKAVSVVLWDRDYSKVEQDFKYLENFIPYEIIK